MKNENKRSQTNREKTQTRTTHKHTKQPHKTPNQNNQKQRVFGVTFSPLVGVFATQNGTKRVAFADRRRHHVTKHPTETTKKKKKRLNKSHHENNAKRTIRTKTKYKNQPEQPKQPKQNHRNHQQNKTKHFLGSPFPRWRRRLRRGTGIKRSASCELSLPALRTDPPPPSLPQANFSPFRQP